MKKDNYQVITDRILELMEEHGTNWCRPWKTRGKAQPMGLPYSMSTGDAYQGINSVLLWSADYDNLRWGTYKAWQAKDAQVRKGQKGTQVIWWNVIEKKNEDSGKVEKIPCLKVFSVFNAEQCDNVPEEKMPEPLPIPERNARVDEFIAGTGADVREDPNRAFFIPSADFIAVPDIAQFKDVEAYYSTLLHELTHWSGHKSRLDRDMTGRFGSQGYAKEELIAELGSVFLCADLGVEDQPQANHAKYLNSWMQALKDDKKLIISAASKAKKAVKFLNDLQAEVVSEAA